MAAKKKEVKPTHRAVLSTGETVDYAGAHPTHWSFGGVDADGNRDGSPVRTVPVTSVHHLSEFPDYEEDEDEDGE